METDKVEKVAMDEAVEYLGNCSHYLHGNKKYIYIGDANEALCIQQANFEKNYISKEDALKAFLAVYDSYCICDSTIGKCEACLVTEAFKQLLNIE